MNIVDTNQNLMKYSHKGYAYKSVAKIILLYLAGGLISAIIQSVFFDSETGKIFSIYSQGVLQILLLLLPTLYFAKRALLPTSILFRKKNPVNILQIFAGIIGILSFQIFAIGFTIVQEKIIPDFLLGYYKEIEIMVEKMYNSILGGSGYLDMSRALLIGALIPAITEETLFRGFLQSSLEQEYKPAKAIIITSLIFAILHFNPIGFIPLICIGIYLGFVAYATNNLILPMIIHFVNNTFAILMIYNQDLTELENNVSQVSSLTGFLLIITGLILIFTSSFIIFHDNKLNQTL